MKKLAIRLKGLIFALTAAMVSVTVLCAMGVYEFVLSGYYDFNVEEIFLRRSLSYIYSDSNTIMRGYVNGDSLDEYAKKFTNLRFQITDKEGKILFSNFNQTTQTEWYYTDYVKITVDQYGNSDALIHSSFDDYDYIFKAYTELSSLYDKYYELNGSINARYNLRFAPFIVGAVTAVSGILLFAVLMKISARRADTDELVPWRFHKVPFDLLAAATFVIFMIVYEVYRISVIKPAEFAAALSVIQIVLWVCAFLGLCMSVAARIKMHTFLKNNIISYIILTPVKMMRYVYPKISVVWKVGLAAVIYTLLDVILLLLSERFIGAGNYALTLVSLIIKVLFVLPFVLYIAVMMNKLEKGARELAKGNSGYKTDTAYMLPSFKRHGENLNSISEGMSRAVESKMKSERLRTELITNVSHDIKNPLTSIINYSDLIVREDCSSSKHKEYAEVLERKAEHLKRLLEDLIELSKASTGNMTAELTELDAVVLTNQLYGEFYERCNLQELSLVVKAPTEPVTIKADNRKIWRVFENLMSNVCKYSLTGTRIYLDLEADEEKAIFTLKNTSAEPLDISPDELMERFVRADSSRTTSGNGLGLSIAKSLTEIQGGIMDVIIDGDLFKVTLAFNRVQTA